MKKIQVKIIKDRFLKSCSICGKNINIVRYTDNSYRNGHFFCKVPEFGKKYEYWECSKCYWSPTKK